MFLFRWINKIVVFSTNSIVARSSESGKNPSGWRREGEEYDDDDDDEEEECALIKFLTLCLTKWEVTLMSVDTSLFLSVDLFACHTVFLLSFHLSVSLIRLFLCFFLITLVTLQWWLLYLYSSCFNTGNKNSKVPQGCGCLLPTSSTLFAKRLTVCIATQKYCLLLVDVWAHLI